MTDPDYAPQSFVINAQFPAIFEPQTSPFSDKAMYSVTFDHAEIPQPTSWYVRANAHNRVSARSMIAPPLVAVDGQDARLHMLLELAAASRVKHRLLTLQLIMITVQPYVVRHPFARVPVALSLRTVGLYVTNLETRYEQLMDELREELRQ